MSKAIRSEKTCTLKEKLVDDLLAGRDPQLKKPNEKNRKKTIEKRKLFGKEFYELFEDSDDAALPARRNFKRVFSWE